MLGPPYRIGDYWMAHFDKEYWVKSVSVKTGNLLSHAEQMAYVKIYIGT